MSEDEEKKSNLSKKVPKIEGYKVSVIAKVGDLIDSKNVRKKEKISLCHTKEKQFLTMKKKVPKKLDLLPKKILPASRK
jgi:hypothetical protein